MTKIQCTGPSAPLQGFPGPLNPDEQGDQKSGCQLDPLQAAPPPRAAHTRSLCAPAPPPVPKDSTWSAVSPGGQAESPLGGTTDIQAETGQVDWQGLVTLQTLCPHWLGTLWG